MQAVITLLRIIYILLMLPLVCYAFSTFYLVALYIRNRKKRPRRPRLMEGTWPTVTIQLPLFNESAVAVRLVKTCAALDYPRDRLSIQVLDDSTDETTALLEQEIPKIQAQGIHIQLIHRGVDRKGYKAGALANGLRQSTSEFVAIFDADFIPAPDFLRKTIPYFRLDKKIGVVQARWTHLNPKDNLLTRSEAMMLDGHFMVEQFARFSGNLLFTFNGTCGIWRRKCIDEAGGWEYDTLTEDSDLSLRAQMSGWRFMFVPDVIVPGEIPAQMYAFKKQQYRWAKGTTQVLLKLWRPLLNAPLSLRKRVMALLQLLPYPSQLLALIVLLLMPVLIWTQALDQMPLGPLGFLGAAVPMLYILSQQALYQDWLHRVSIFPVLMVLSSGLAVNNARAVLEALRGKVTPFERTPKVGVSPGTPILSPDVFNSPVDPYTYPQPMEDSKPIVVQKKRQIGDSHTLWEVLFGLYALFGALLAWVKAPAMVPYFALYVVGFFTVAFSTLADSIQTP